MVRLQISSLSLVSYIELEVVKWLKISQMTIEYYMFLLTARALPG